MNYLDYLINQVQISKKAWVAPSAILAGRIQLDDDVSVWHGVIMRAEGDSIHIQEGTNIQDGAIFHVDPGFTVIVGKNTTIGHGAIVHGAQVGNNSLIGIRATLLNGSKVGNNCVIAANCLVTEGMQIPDNSLVMGIPAKIMGTITEKLESRMSKGAQHYIGECKKYLLGEDYA